MLLFGFGLIATILNVYLFIWSDMKLALLNVITKYVSEWIMIIALIGFAKKYLNFRSKASDYMNRRAFLFYIYHFIWVVLFQYTIYGFVGNRTLVLFIATIMLSYLMTFICSEISSRISFLCRLTGTKYQSKSK